MAFNDDGTLRPGDRPNQPQGWRQTRGVVLHHMIDWQALRETWNSLVRLQFWGEMVRYMDLIGYGGPQLREQTVRRIPDETFLRMGLGERDDLEMRLCWQRYNLFEGPTADSRPMHSPDPARMIQYFRNEGATTFDFPIVAPPHGQRANTLWRAFLQLAAFTRNGDAQEARKYIREACHLVESVRDCGVLPAWEVNWFGLSQKLFWGMSRSRKREFFLACDRRGWRKAKGEAVYAELFGR